MDYKKLSTKAATPPHLESPAVKRQKKSDGGYNSTATSAQNTGPYNSDNDSGDELFAGWVPDTPGGYQTQPTQIIDRSLQVGSNPPDTTNHIVQVPASSPFSGRDNHSPQPAANNVNKLVQNGGSVARNPVSMGMAPAGTTYRPPQGIVSKPVLNFITIEDDDDGPQFQGGSSDEDVLTSADIKPTMFMSRSANNSFGTSATKDGSKNGNGNAKFMDIVQNAAYKPQQQTRPERAQPVTGNVFDTWSEKEMLDRINQVRKIVPNMGEMTIKNALSMNKGSLDDTVAYLCDEERLVAQRPTSHWQSKPGVRIEISDDEIELPLASKAQPDMKRVLAKPVQSINQKYSSTQTLLPKPVSTSTPPKPKRRLVPGRRNPSSPAAPSPLRPDSPAAESYDSDSGVGSVVEEDPELEVRVLSYLNKCTVTELIELTATKQEIAELMISARPFKTLDAARCVENVKVLKSGKKSNRAPVGDKVVDKALEMFQGYEAIDTLIERCSDIGKPLADEMATWGFDVFGARKGGELEITSLEENDSLQDSGVGSPASGLASAIVDDDVKIISRKRSAVQFLKKPEIMADSCKLKDYQVVGLNWLALMYRKKLSGILADEMGLGKTCQVISFLSHLMEQGNHGPHLVVCPGTTLENWMREFQKFSPQVVTYAYHGKQTERPEMAEFVLENRDRINVVVTTYEMAASKEDNKFMRKLRPDVSIVIRRDVNKY
jgi:SWI/SNF-related matrix-associated actin-dependent regulator 1 of chromatin subfamily A